MHRERVALSAVYHTALPDPGTAGGKVGYLRLAQFNSSAADDMKAAIEDLEVGVGERAEGTRETWGEGGLGPSGCG